MGRPEGRRRLRRNLRCILKRLKAGGSGIKQRINEEGPWKARGDRGDRGGGGGRGFVVIPIRWNPYRINSDELGDCSWCWGIAAGAGGDRLGDLGRA